MSPTIEWVAGLLEGEGCFTIHRHPRKAPVVELSMTDRDAVERVAEFFSHGNITTDVSHDRSTRRKRRWRWSLYGKRAAAAMYQLYPHLCERRRARIVEVLSECQYPMPTSDWWVESAEAS